YYNRGVVANDTYRPTAKRSNHRTSSLSVSFARHQVHPQMPAEDTREGLKMRHRERRRVHEILIAAFKLEVWKIRTHGRKVVDLAIGVFRTVRVPVDEVRHLQ